MATDTIHSVIQHRGRNFQKPTLRTQSGDAWTAAGGISGVQRGESLAATDAAPGAQPESIQRSCGDRL